MQGRATRRGSATSVPRPAVVAQARAVSNVLRSEPWGDRGPGPHLLLALAQRVDEHGLVHLDYAVAAATAGVQVATVARWVRRWEAAGLLVRHGALLRFVGLT